ncbi:MAG: hypothetical protein ACM3MA_00310 [Acidobacteriota bacterium]
MTTTEAVNVALEIIGKNGLSGVVCEATSLPKALRAAGVTALPSSQLDQVAAELRRQKLVEVTRQNKHLLLQLSVKGVHRLQLADVRKVTLKKPATWDKKWRMVTYDVPVALSAKRRLFTRELERLGFTMIRESVWFHPYPCFDELSNLAAYCGIVRHVTFGEIDRLDTVTREKLRRAYPM